MSLSSFHNVFLTAQGKRKRTSKEEVLSPSAEIGNAVHAMVQSEFAAKGVIAAAEVPLVDANNEMVSKVDAVTTAGQPLEIKSVSLSEITIMREPRPDHKLQLQYYLQAYDDDNMEGILLYVAREAPGIRKAFVVTVDGDVSEASAQSITYMKNKRMGTNPYQLQAALTNAVAEFKTNQQLKDEYQDNVKKYNMLARRQREARKRKDFDTAYKFALSGIEQGKLIRDGMSEGVAKKSRRSITDFGSPYGQGKNWKERDIDKLQKQNNYHKRKNRFNNIPNVDFDSMRDKITHSVPAFEPKKKKKKAKIVPQPIKPISDFRSPVKQLLSTMPAAHGGQATNFYQELATIKAMLAHDSLKGIDGPDPRDFYKGLLQSDPGEAVKMFADKVGTDSRIDKIVRNLKGLALLEKGNEPVMSAIAFGHEDEALKAFLKKDGMRDILEEVMEFDTPWADFKKRITNPNRKKGIVIPEKKKKVKRPRIFNVSEGPYNYSGSKRFPQPEPTKGVPTFRGARREVFFDIETTLPREGSKLPPRMLEFTGAHLDDMMTTGAHAGGDLGEAIISRMDEVSRNANVFRSSMLDLNTADEILKSRRVSDLIKSGIVDIATLGKIEKMAERSGFDDVMKFIKADVSNYLEGVSERQNGKRVLLGAYQERAKGLPTSKTLGHYYNSQEAMLQNINEYLHEASKSAGTGKHQLIGHNIRDFDLPVMRKLSQIHGIEMSNNIDEFKIVDTYRGSSGINLQDKMKSNPSEYNRIRNLKVNNKGIMSLENLAEMFGLTTHEMKTRYEHISSLFDVQMNVGVKMAGEHANVQGAMLNYEEMANNAENAVRKSKVMHPKMNDVSPVVRDLTEGKIEQMRMGRAISHSNIENTRIMPQKSGGTKMMEFTDKILSEIFGSERMKDAKSVLSNASSLMDDMKPAGAEFLKNLKNEASNTAIGKAMNLKNVRGGAFAAIGGIAAMAGMSLLAMSSMIDFRGLDPTKKKYMMYKGPTPIVLSADDKDHALDRYTGPQAEYMRMHMTDFGSGYQGRVGSALAMLKANIAKGNKVIKNVMPSFTKAEHNSIYRAEILDPVGANHGNVIQQPVKQNIQEVVLPNGSSYHHDTLGVRYNRKRDIERTLNRKKKIRQLQSQGSRPIFEMNERRRGSYRG